MGNDKGKKLAAGLMMAALTVSLSGCGNALPPVPKQQGCDDWEWDDDLGVYQCDDQGSSNYHGYYYGGSMYRTKSALMGSKSYVNYTKGSSFKGKSGFGTGTKGSTGS